MMSHVTASLKNWRAAISLLDRKKALSLLSPEERQQRHQEPGGRAEKERSHAAAKFNEAWRGAGKCGPQQGLLRSRESEEEKRGGDVSAA